MYSLPVDDLESIFLRLKNIWPKKKVLFITGGTGFFGRWLIESISYIEEKLKSENTIYVVSRQERDLLVQKMGALSHPFFHVVKLDLNNKFSFEESVDYVIHAATDVSVIKNSLTHNFAPLVTQTKNVLLGTRINSGGKFLYVSSGGVYSPLEQRHKEDSLHLEPNEQIDSYAEAKRQSEILVNELSDSCIARCFSFVGPYADEKMVAMDMLNKKVCGLPIVLNSPEVIRSFMYPSDLVVCLFKLLLLKNKSRVYNVGADEPISLFDLAKKIASLAPSSNVEVKESSNGVSLAGQCYYPNTDRITAEFGNLQTVDLDSALQKTYKFLYQRKTA